MTFVHVKSAVEEYCALPHVQEIINRVDHRESHDDDWMLCHGIAVLYTPHADDRSPLLVAISFSDDLSVDLRTYVKWASILDNYATVCDGYDLDIVLGIRK